MIFLDFYFLVVKYRTWLDDFEIISVLHIFAGIYWLDDFNNVNVQLLAWPVWTILTSKLNGRFWPFSLPVRSGRFWQLKSACFTRLDDSDICTYYCIYLRCFTYLDNFYNIYICLLYLVQRFLQNIFVDCTWLENTD